MLVILCDGSSKGNPGPASIGVVAWDRASNPRLIMPNYHFHKDIGNATVMEAEWEALLQAMRFAINKNPTQEIYIFSDSQVLVKQVNEEWNVKHEHIIPRYKEFLAMKPQLPNLHINWVPRQLIYLADKAAQKGGE